VNKGFAGMKLFASRKYPCISGTKNTIMEKISRKINKA